MKDVQKKKVFKILALIMVVILIVQPLTSWVSTASGINFIGEARNTGAGDLEKKDLGVVSEGLEDVVDDYYEEESEEQEETEEQAKFIVDYFEGKDEAQAEVVNELEESVFAFDVNTIGVQSGTDENPYLIRNADDLEQLGQYVNSNAVDENGKPYADLSYKLTDDIDLSGYSQWVPIGMYRESNIDWNRDLMTDGRVNYRRPFRGTLDGDGHTISYLRTARNFNTTYGYTRGLFGFTEDAVIKNLNISNAVIDGRGSSGILIGYSVGEVKLENCHVSGEVTTSGDWAGTGGLIGFLTMEKEKISPLIKNCTAEVKITSTLGTGRTGGLIGFVRSGNESYSNNNRASWESTLSIEDCFVSGSVIASYYHLGGLIGEIYFGFSNKNTVIINDCQMEASINGLYDAYHTGGMIGYLYSINSDENTVTIEGCSVDSTEVKTLRGSAYHVGGAIGYVYSDHSNKLDVSIIQNDIKIDDLKIENTASYDIGGVIGNYHVTYSEYNSMRIKGCLVSGKVIDNAAITSGTTAGTGGLIGTVKYNFLNTNNGSNGTGHNKLIIEDCDVETTEIKGNGDNIGGLIGLYYNYKSDDSILIINNSNVKSEAVYGYSLPANVTYNRRVGGAIGWYRIEGESVASGNFENDPLYYRADRTYFEMNDCTVKSDVYTETYYGGEVGGIAGYLYAFYAPYAEVHINNCVTEGNISTLGVESYRVGGIAGIMNFNASSYSIFEMKDCIAYGNVTTSGTNGYKVGGVLGELLYGGSYRESEYQGVHAVVQCTANIINCHSYAEKVSTTGSGAYYVGGLIGVTDVNKFANRTRVLIEGCSASGDVSSNSYYVGGLIGFSENASPDIVIENQRQNVQSTYNNADDDKNAAQAMYTTVRNCYATGNVSAGAPNLLIPSAGTNAGGLIGHCHAGDGLPHDAMVIENCYATGNVSITNSSGYNAGGFIGRPSKNITIKNCYSTGDVYALGIHTGGFIGFGEGDATGNDRLTVLNCYSTGNVVGGNYGTGGFIGYTQYTFIKNCYAIGSVHNTRTSNINYTGSFTGWSKYGGRIENCYATGTVSTGYSSNYTGGFIGFRDTTEYFPLYITDCLYDTTTSQMSKGIGIHTTSTAANNNLIYITENGRTITDISGYKTKAMIDHATYEDIYSSWSVKNNVCAVPSSRNEGTTNSPWYIDDDITYPYLYFQADGYNTVLDSNPSAYKPVRLDDNSIGEGFLNNITVNSKSRNYYLGSLGNSKTVGGPYKAVVAERADYNSSTALEDLNSQYMATSAGAVRAYFPYTHGTNYNNYNSYQYWFNGGAVYIPRSELYNHTANSFYSLGAISETNIVAFRNGPFAAKDSDRPNWINGNEDTYTYVGQTVEYTVDIANYSTKAKWLNVVMTDPLVYGVTLIDGEVYADYGNGEIPIQYWDGSGSPPLTRPYYTYRKGELGSEYDGRFILEVVLGDFSEAKINGSEMEAEGCTVKFKVLVGREAATIFNDDGSWDGENIRNRGTVSGTLEYSDDTPDTFVEVDIDDNNEDPVYDTYLVIYNSNYDLNGISDDTDTEIIKDYLLRDGSGSHMVLPNIDRGDDSDYVGFDFPGYEFDGWFYLDEDGVTLIEVKPDDIILNVNRDITIFAKWTAPKYTFEFYKKDSKDNNLADAEFEVYAWRGSGTPENDDLVDNDNTANGNWEKVGSYISNVDNPISIAFSESGYYQLVEVSAPNGYQTPDVQWRFEVDLSNPEEPVLIGPKMIKGQDSKILLNIEKDAESGEWKLINHSILELELLKISNAYYHSDGDTYADILTGASFELYLWTGGNREKGLVTIESIEAGDWTLHNVVSTDSDGVFSFTFINDSSIYQLVETAAPENFQLPTGQWRFEINEAGSIEDIDISSIKGTDGVEPPALQWLTAEFDGEHEGKLGLVNFKEYSLPSMGGTGIQIFMVIGLLLIATGTIWALSRRRRRLAIR